AVAGGSRPPLGEDGAAATAWRWRRAPVAPAAPPIPAPVPAIVSRLCPLAARRPVVLRRLDACRRRGQPKGILRGGEGACRRRLGDREAEEAGKQCRCTDPAHAEHHFLL